MPFLRLVAANPLVDGEHAVELGGGGLECELAEVGIGVRRRHSHERPDLRVRELAPRERLLDRGQVGQGSADADVLPGGNERHAAAPREPVGRGLHAPTGPSLPAIDLGLEPLEREPGALSGLARDLCGEAERMAGGIEQHSPSVG